MTFYADKIRPHIVDALCAVPLVNENRRRTAASARGEVLEIGFGGARNLRFYDPTRVTKLWGLEPNRAMRRKALARTSGTPFAIELLDRPAEEIPLEDDSVDTVVSTCTLCTIPGVEAALSEVHRVLKPDGRFLFMEHGASPDIEVRRWQDRMNGAFVRFSCHLNRPIADLVAHAGFETASLDAGYVPPSGSWPNMLRAISFEYVGSALPKSPNGTTTRADRRQS